MTKKPRTPVIPLRARLAALHARAALQEPGGQPAEKEIQRLLDSAAGHPLPVAKRTLLLRSLLAQADITGMARRMTPEAAVALLERKAGPARDDDVAADGLTVERLEALLPEMWRQCIPWLLEQEGLTVEHLNGGMDGAEWRAEDGNTRYIVSTLRLREGEALTEEDVRRAADAAAKERDARALLISPSAARIEAQLAAQRLDVRLVDRAALSERLARFATAYEREATRALHEQEARAAAASEARAGVLTALQQVRDALTALAKEKGRPAGSVLTAASELTQVAQTLDQFGLAWDTLLSDWSAAFGERAARNGTLSLLAQPPALCEYAERAKYLGEFALTTLSRLRATPSEGELGYTAWRQALIEQVEARYEAMYFRVKMLDPLRWQSFAAAFSEEDAQRAAQATIRAEHASARAAKARGDFAQRAGTGTVSLAK